MSQTNISPTQLVYSLDTETTGVDPQIDRVRSLGLVAGTLRGGVVSRYSILIDTKGVSSNPQALGVHKIPDNLPGGLDLPKAILALTSLIGDSQVMAHNAKFDIDMLTACLTRDEAPIPDFLKRPWIDTMSLAAKNFPGTRHNLDSLSRQCDVSLANANRKDRHDATEDAELCFLCWQHMTTPSDLFLSEEKTPQKHESFIESVPELPRKPLGW